jgi:hypothetical protein
MKLLMKRSEGLEMVEVAILIAVVVALGLIFKAQLTAFVNKVFGNLMNADF